MPKIVDHDHKRKIIAETAWRIIETEGIEKASIRRIASEAGMSTGALRHYFSNQDELLLFIMEYFLARGKERSENKSWSKNPLIAVQESLLELVPVDRDKQTETCVWLVFAIRSFRQRFRFGDRIKKEYLYKHVFATKTEAILAI